MFPAYFMNGLGLFTFMVFLEVISGVSASSEASPLEVCFMMFLFGMSVFFITEGIKYVTEEVARRRSRCAARSRHKVMN